MSIRTKIFTTDNFPVPSEWIFEKFLNLKEKLTGQSVSIHSIFNREDKNPSMVLFLSNKGRYRFKDFSANIEGDGVELIQLIYGLETRQKAFVKVYDLYLEDDGENITSLPLIKIEKEIINVENREWNVLDKNYWTAYHISASDLEHHNIKAIKSYTFKMTQGEIVKNMEFKKQLCYGFYRADGTLYKIYNPQEDKSKFIKILKSIQGHDQLEYKGEWLMILASMKDLITFKKLGFPNIECVAPESENVMLTKAQVDFYKTKYKLITVLFDNDKAGRESMVRYNEELGIHPILFDIEKDVAECVKEHGIRNSQYFLMEVLLKRKNEILNLTLSTG